MKKIEFEVEGFFIANEKNGTKQFHITDSKRTGSVMVTMKTLDTSDLDGYYTFAKAKVVIEVEEKTKFQPGHDHKH